jgi:hypothetical protein
MRFRALQPVFVLVVLALGQNASQSQTYDDHLIVAHQRIGVIAIGMTQSDLVLGRGTPGDIISSACADDKAGDAILHYDGQQTGVCINRKQRVDHAWTSNPLYRTEGGIHVGSSESDLLRAHGSTRVVRHCNNINNFYDYHFQGISFTLSCGLINGQAPAGQITTIWIEK